MTRLPTNRPPAHPGELLLELFLEPAGLSQYKLAKETGLSYRRVNEIVKGKRGVTLDTAMRFAQFFDTTAEVWMNAQFRWDLWMFRKSKAMKEVSKIPTLTRLLAARD